VDRVQAGKGLNLTEQQSRHFGQVSCIWCSYTVHIKTDHVYSTLECVSGGQRYLCTLQRRLTTRCFSPLPSTAPSRRPSQSPLSLRSVSRETGESDQTQ
jgi:hypothetical protein